MTALVYIHGVGGNSLFTVSVIRLVHGIGIEVDAVTRVSMTHAFPGRRAIGRSDSCFFHLVINHLFHRIQEVRFAAFVGEVEREMDHCSHVLVASYVLVSELAANVLFDGFDNDHWVQAVYDNERHGWVAKQNGHHFHHTQNLVLFEHRMLKIDTM